MENIDLFKFMENIDLNKVFMAVVILQKNSANNIEAVKTFKWIAAGNIPRSKPHRCAKIISDFLKRKPVKYKDLCDLKYPNKYESAMSLFIFLLASNYSLDISV